MKDLQETVDLMLSGKWEDRLIAEYWQTKIRYNKLHNTLVQCNAGVHELDFAEEHLMRLQASAMGEYLYRLEVRAARAGVNLDV